MKIKFMKAIAAKAGKAGFQLQKHSPEILVAAGIVGTVVSTVMACRATTKAGDILEEAGNQLEKIRRVADDEEKREEHGYTSDDEKKDKAIVYTQTAVRLVKLYAPAVILGMLSIAGIIGSNRILKKRNAALSAAYVAIDKSFKEYRGRVVDRFGKEVDKQLKYNIKAGEAEETTTDEKGRQKTKKTPIQVADPDAAGSAYAKYFTQANPNWQNDPSYNEQFFRMQQNFANDRLRAVGHVTLNEVYQMLGLKDTRAGMVVGWIYDPVNPVGDNYVEFDVERVHIPSEDGRYEMAYAIDFNVDGNIYDRMA